MTSFKTIYLTGGLEVAKAHFRFSKTLVVLKCNLFALISTILKTVAFVK